MTQNVRSIDKSTKATPAPDGKKFIVLQKGTWGAGKTIDDALRESRRLHGKGLYLVYEVVEGARVDEHGSICRPEGSAVNLLLYRVGQRAS